MDDRVIAWKQLRLEAQTSARETQVAWALLWDQSQMAEATEGDIDILCQDYGRARLREERARKAAKDAYPFWAKADD